MAAIAEAGAPIAFDGTRKMRVGLTKDRIRWVIGILLLLFAEVGARPEDDLFLRVEYDGEIASNGATYARARQDFAVLSGTRQSVEMMEGFLKSEHKSDASFETAVNSGLDAWSVGHMILQASEAKELPARDAVAQHRQEQLTNAAIEAAVLERDGSRPIRYRSLTDNELRSIISR